MTTEVVAPVDIDKEIMRLCRKAAVEIHGRYRDYTEFGDVYQEVVLYSLDKGKVKLHRWATKEDQQDGWRRLYLDLKTVAKAYCENEKAVKCGYSFDDIMWYRPAHLQQLIPIALDPEFDGLVGSVPEPTGSRQRHTGKNEGNSLLAMICDVRWALARMESAPPDDLNSDEGEAFCIEMADLLGGDFPGSPAKGRGRRVMSNAESAAVQGENENVARKLYAERMNGQ